MYLNGLHFFLTRNSRLTNQRPIKPPLELVSRWSATIYGVTEDDNERDFYIATQAARWGADQELDACCEWVSNELSPDIVDMVRAARRPKPPSLKTQALDELASAERLYPADWSTVRRALEALPDD